jgi:rhodanese-related sulfurtransferase
MGFVIDGIWHLSPSDCFKLCKQNAVIVDVREEYMNSFKMFDVDEIIYCPFSNLMDRIKQLPDDKLLIFADASGLKSKESVQLMNEKGFINIANMAGGLVEWERDGLPLKTDKTNRLRGSCMCQLKFRDIKTKQDG